MKVSGNNISMIRGDSETITVTCKDLTDSIIPLETGDTIYFTIKDNVNTEVKILQKVITVFTDGIAIIEILPADTKPLKYKDYLYDVQLTRENHTVTTIIKPSKFTIEGEVTYE